MEEDLIPRRPEYKLYKDKPVFFATFLGGPLAAGYLMAENYKSLGQRNKALKTWIVAISATLIIFVSLFVIPGAEKIPNMIVPLAYSALTQILAKHLQGKEIATHIEQGGETFSIGRIIVVGLIGLLVSFVIIMAIVLVLPDEIVKI